MKKSIILSLLATLLAGCNPLSHSIVYDAPRLVVYRVVDQGVNATGGRYECSILNEERSNWEDRFTLVTNQRFNVGDRVVITRVGMEDAKVKVKP